jgi:hypothetical protein
MKCRRKLTEALIEAGMRCVDSLRCLKASAHHKGICGVISELLVLDDVSTAIEHGCGHCMNDAWLICTLQGSDEIHVRQFKGN